MPADAEARPDGDHWYSYAVLRVVPNVEREEFVNAGVILFSRSLRFLGAKIELDEGRLAALSPGLDIEVVRAHLRSYEDIVAGDERGGSIAGLSQSERFHWLTSPRSTILQTSPVHVGRCKDPAKALEELMDELVRR
jgi:hypothetical protein